jgi:hypothetical protein
LGEFGARDQPVDGKVAFDDGERLKLIGKGQDGVAAGFEHAGDDQPRGAAGIYEHDAHRIALFPMFRAIRRRPLSLN